MRFYEVAAFSFVFLLETTAFLLHESINTFHHECLPAVCRGCRKFVQHSSFWPILTYDIHCPNAGLTSFPIVKAIDMNMNLSTVTIYYSGNHLTAVPANAFRNIHPRGYTFKGIIYLDNNSISTIDLDAFNGIADSISLLFINDNKLDHLPGALSKLSSLSELHIQNNPIRYVDSAITAALGSNFRLLEIDLGHVSSWPEAINNLHNMTHLFLYNITMELKDVNIFHGLTGLKHMLMLDYKVKDHGPNFLTIPPAVTRLPHFTELQIKGEVYCTCGLSYLAHWKMPLLFFNTCHGNPGQRVNHYIANIASHCHG